MRVVGMQQGSLNRSFAERTFEREDGLRVWIPCTMHSAVVVLPCLPVPSVLDARAGVINSHLRHGVVGRKGATIPVGGEK